MDRHSPQSWFSLEEKFFANVDQALLSVLREQGEIEQTAESIMRVTGINDPLLAAEIAKQKVSVETLSAFRLAPMVAVAWADDRVEENERYVITQAAEKSGISADDPAMKLLASWTEKRPPADLLDTWCDYAKALSASLDETHRLSLRDQILGQAKSVAEATGGLLGFGSVSPNEKATIERIAAALS